MYESFFGMEHTPFTRDIPVERLYTSPRIEDAHPEALMFQGCFPSSPQARAALWTQMPRSPRRKRMQG